MSPHRVVIVGGGITGLTAAYRLLRAGRDAAGAPFSVTVLEARARLGGNILTERRDGCVLDGGPDAFIAARPQATKLCKELGLGDRLMGTTERNRKVYIRQDGVLHPLPEGLVLAIPTRILPLAASKLFTWPGKLRMGLDLVLPRRRDAGDESIGRFIRRRLGREALERLAEPLLGGIYAGNVDALSLKATFPQLAELERDSKGTSSAAPLAQRAARGARREERAPPSTFQSLAGGMGELTDTLYKAIQSARRHGAPHAPRSRRRSSTGPDGARLLAVKVKGDAEALLADDVVLCAPAYAAADALDGLDRELSGRLREIPYVSTATIVIGYARADVAHPLDALGSDHPQGREPPLAGGHLHSSEQIGSRPLPVRHGDAPPLRRRLPRPRRPLPHRPRAGRHGLRQSWMHRSASGRAPLLTRVFRWDRANAQPSVGHPDRLRKLRPARPPPPRPRPRRQRLRRRGHPRLHPPGEQDRRADRRQRGERRVAPEVSPRGAGLNARPPAVALRRAPGSVALPCRAPTGRLLAALGPARRLPIGGEVGRRGGEASRRRSASRGRGRVGGADTDARRRTRSRASETRRRTSEHGAAPPRLEGVLRNTVLRSRDTVPCLRDNGGAPPERGGAPPNTAPSGGSASRQIECREVLRCVYHATTAAVRSVRRRRAGRSRGALQAKGGRASRRADASVLHTLHLSSKREGSRSARKSGRFAVDVDRARGVRGSWPRAGGKPDGHELAASAR